MLLVSQCHILSLGKHDPTIGGLYLLDCFILANNKGPKGEVGLMELRQ